MGKPDKNLLLGSLKAFYKVGELGGGVNAEGQRRKILQDSGLVFFKFPGRWYRKG